MEHLQSAVAAAKWEQPDHTHVLTDLQTTCFEEMAQRLEALLQKASRQMEYWRRRRDSLQPSLESWRRQLPDKDRAVIGKLNPFLLEAMLSERHQDAAYMADFWQGFSLTEEVSIGGPGTDIPGGMRSRGRPDASLVTPLGDLRAGCLQANNKLIRQARDAFQKQRQIGQSFSVSGRRPCVTSTCGVQGVH